MGHSIENEKDSNGSKEDGFNEISYSSNSITDSIVIEGKMGHVNLSLECFERIRDKLVAAGAIGRF